MSKASWDRMNPKALAAMRNERLHRQFRYQLYAFSPFYREKLDDLKLGPDGVSEVADLPQAPLVTRAMLAASPTQFSLRPTRRLIQKFGAPGQLVAVSLEMILHGSQRSEELVRNEYEPVHQLATSGTQGSPVSINLSKRDLSSLAVQGQRTLQIAGVTASDKILNLLPNQASSGFWTLWLGGVSLGIEQSAPPGPVEAGRAIDLLEAERATVVIGEAAFLLEMLRAGRRQPPNLRRIILAPRVTPPSLRKELEEAAGRPTNVLATYGFAEGRSVWVECLEGGSGSGFHAFPDMELFEVLSAGTETPVDPAAGGELVFTGLAQRGTALARYRPGDIVKAVQSGPCPYCGRNVDRIIGPVQRVGRLVTVRAEGAAPLEIDEEVLAGAMSHPDLAGWQLEVTKMSGQSNGYDELCLLFKPKDKVDPASLAVELDAVLRKELGLSPQMILSDRVGGGVLDLRQR